MSRPPFERQHRTETELRDKAISSWSFFKDGSRTTELMESCAIRRQESSTEQGKLRFDMIMRTASR